MSVAAANDRNEAYTPHLKRVLKIYQAAATNSLHGPNTVLWSDIEKDESSLPSIDAIPQAQPIQQPPLLLPLARERKSAGQRTSTLLEGEPIACFNVGGEERLCLPQILNTVLRNFSLLQINSVCDDLQIYCSRCTEGQLTQLKEASILPYRISSCGLITKSDAERLCASLLHIPDVDLKNIDDLGVPVYHECFGGCEGTFYPDLYGSPGASCIRCQECRGFLPPKQFISHVHRERAETRTCHWGFNSANWRLYLLPLNEDNEIEKTQLEDYKSKFSNESAKKTTDFIENYTPTHSVGAKTVGPRTSQKIFEDVDEDYQHIHQPDDDLPAAKKLRKTEDEIDLEVNKQHLNCVPLQTYPFVKLGSLDPSAWYQWSSGDSNRQLSAFKPLLSTDQLRLSREDKLNPIVHASQVNLSSTPSSKKQKLLTLSTSIESSEDAFSTGSTLSSMSESDELADLHMSDLVGITKVLDLHNINGRARKDVLHEAVKIIYGHQQVIASLAKQKLFLEKKVEKHAAMKEGGHLKCSESATSPGPSQKSVARNTHPFVSERKSCSGIDESQSGRIVFSEEPVHPSSSPVSSSSSSVQQKNCGLVVV